MHPVPRTRSSRGVGQAGVTLVEAREFAVPVVELRFHATRVRRKIELPAHEVRLGLVRIARAAIRVREQQRLPFMTSAKTLSPSVHAFMGWKT